MGTNVVRSFAVRDLPDEISGIEINRSDAAVGRLQKRQALRSESTLPAGWSRGCAGPGRTGRIRSHVLAGTCNITHSGGRESFDVIDIGELPVRRRKKPDRRERYKRGYVGDMRLR